MAEKIKSDDEPSIEEILDSIRQIISEDDKEPAGEAIDPARELVPIADEPEMDEIDALLATGDDPVPEVSDEDDDVFELTERIDPEVVFEEPEPEFEPVAPPPPPVSVAEEPVAKIEEAPFVVDLIDESSDDVQEQSLESPVKSENTAPITASMAEDSILTETAETAAIKAISELARRTAIEHSGVTIEEIVRSELKPLLRGWLDKNLPVVIERLVREELERVSKRVLED